MIMQKVKMNMKLVSSMPEKFHGVQCPRCWNWFEEGELVDGLCPRCHEVVETLPSSEEE